VADVPEIEDAVETRDMLRHCDSPSASWLLAVGETECGPMQPANPEETQVQRYRSRFKVHAVGRECSGFASPEGSIRSDPVPAHSQ
jgi:hypothetical protein